MNVSESLPGTGMTPFTSILVDIDATAAAQPALERATRIAARCGARLRIVDVVCPPGEAQGYLRADVERGLMLRRREQLWLIAGSIKDVAVDARVLYGLPAIALVQEVVRNGHDLLVRAHTRDLVSSKSCGSVSLQLFRTCPCPVWAVGPGAMVEHPKIMGAVHSHADDGRALLLNRKIIALALFIAALERGSVILVEAWRPVGQIGVLHHATDDEFAFHVRMAQRVVIERLRALRDAFGGASSTKVREDISQGDPADVIPRYAVAEGVDLVVVGTNARTGIARLFLGNTADRLLGRLPCSVLAVKPDGFISPVRLDESV